MKSGAKHSEVFVSEVFLSTLGSGRILILCLRLLSRETFASPQEHADNLVTAGFQSQYRLSTPGDVGLTTRVFWLIFLNLPSKEEVT